MIAEKKKISQEKKLMGRMLELIYFLEMRKNKLISGCYTLVDP
jgi:hypothetical protein